MEAYYSYSKEHKKSSGAFYTPSVVSDFLAQTILTLKGASVKAILDPAVGNGELLRSFKKKCSDLNKVFYLGIDTDKKAIYSAKRSFIGLQSPFKFICTDTLRPYHELNSERGWNRLCKEVGFNSFDVIVCNPPWGAEIEEYKAFHSDFPFAIGQFDIYDLFVDIIIRKLSDDGVYGLILPDSIYGHEHLRTRKLLFDKTQVTHIIKLGEFFFDGVNTSVSIIVGRKSQWRNDSVVRCTHITPSQRKNIMCGENNLVDIEAIYHNDIKQRYIVNRGYNIVLDSSSDDISIISTLENFPSFKAVSYSHRGVELSKKGEIHLCPNCNMWSPKDAIKQTTWRCPHCGKTVEIETRSAKIIQDYFLEGYECRPLIVGEDIHRYSLSHKRYIRLGFNGINYKSDKLFEETKVVIRKTGVGITAAIDYDNTYTNQVVYMLSPKAESNIPVELLVAIINSRILTYYLIKIKGINQWQSHPYITQTDIANLPFPFLSNIDDLSLSKIIREIVECVRRIQDNSTDTSFREADIRIEHLVAELYGIDRKLYTVIFRAISESQSLIPFKCLLDISPNDIFQ